MKPFVPNKLPLEKIKWEPLIPYMGRANRELCRYDGLLGVMQNPEVLLSPITTQEAVLSSRIEGTQATLSEVYRYEAGEAPIEESRRMDIQEIINYRKALMMAEEELKTRPFSLNLLKKLHSTLLEDVRGRDRSRGEFRTVQNWIARAGSPIEEADFIPPAPIILMENLDNWEKYYHMERPDLLVQLAIIHAQFEIIHPFLDGNGRLGRMIIPLFLFEKKILTRPTFYVSAYFEEHRDEYIERLRSLGENCDSWNKWILFFLKAIHRQALSNIHKAQQIFDLYEDLKKTVIELTHSQYAIPLLDEMFKRPIFASNMFNNVEGMPTKPAILAMLNKLKDNDILKVIRPGSGRRPQVLALAELINLSESKDVV
ncbi:MAG: Fic/DOC family N-terminal domain-containing protein [Candidatus Aminicenantes bacterium]